MPTPRTDMPKEVTIDAIVKNIVHPGPPPSCSCGRCLVCKNRVRRHRWRALAALPKAKRLRLEIRELRRKLVQLQAELRKAR